MELAIIFWTATVLCSLAGLAPGAAVFSLAFFLAAVKFHPLFLESLSAGLCLVIFLAAPGLLIAAQKRYLKTLRRLQRQHAERKKQLAAAAQNLFSLDAAIASMEKNVAQLTDVYQVTKETAGALRLSDLLGNARESLSRLLPVPRLSLVDLTAETPVISRLKRAQDDRFVHEEAALLPAELSILDQARARPKLEAASQALPNDGVAWVPLFWEQQLLGVLIAETEDAGALSTLSTIAHQLSLQSARIRLYQQVEALAVTDALTGLLVRGYVLNRAKEEIARSQRQGLSCTVLMVDLDSFKQKNDTYGHLVGDAILREVAHILQRNLREVDLIGRFGGEEFFLLLIETHFDQALPIASRLRQLVEIHSIRAFDELLTQTISIGMAGFPEHGKTLEALIEHADQALYAAKRAGRNRVVIWPAPTSSA